MSKDIAKSPFLHTYVEQLKKSTPSSELGEIKAMSDSELILLLHGYGTGIRNQWLHGNREPQLLRFFHENGIDGAEAMSMIIIQALWNELNSSMSPAECASVEAKRALVVRKRSSYEKLEAECEVQLAKARNEFEQCNKKHGLPSENPINRDPFFNLVIESKGRVREIVFFDGVTSELKDCLRKTIQEFTFSTFADDEVVNLYILEFPRCRVSERDTLHSRE